MIQSYINTRTPERINKLKKVLQKRQPGLTIIAENINDPHNLSAMLRTCDAVGILKANLIYHGKQPLPKLGKTSSASAKKWIDLENFNSVEECFEKLKSNGFKIYTTHMSKTSVPLYSLDLTDKCALMFGNEHSGVSEEAYKMADANFLIPQTGLIQSLNISVACAISLYEAYRQRMESGMYDSQQLNSKEFEKYLEDWSRR